MVESGAVLSASGDVTVLAMAGAADEDIPVLNDDAEDVNDKIKADILDSDVSAVRMVSITGGGGFVGVSVAIAALIVQTSTRAIMAGDVTRADNVYVYTQSDYGQILAVTMNASGGVVAVNGSITVVYFGGTVEAGIAGTAHLSIVGAVKVQSRGISRALSAAIAMSGGLVAVNAALALAINITRIDTYIGQGVVIDAASSNITLKSDFTVEADVLIISVAVGGAGVGVTVAIAINRPVCLTYIGKTPYGDSALPGSVGANGYINAHNINVTNDIDGNVNVVGFGIAAGAGGGCNGSVTLGFNRVTGYAAINMANILSANVINVTALMDGDTLVNSTAMVGGMCGQGASVVLAQIKTDNRAMVDVTGVIVHAEALNVNAGTDSNPYDSKALAVAITGAAGVTTVALNFAIAINAASNRALVLGDKANGVGKLDIDGTLNVYAHGVARAYGIIAGASIGGLTVNVSVSLAIIQSVQEAMVSGDARMEIGTLNVESQQNTNIPGFGFFDLIFDEGDNPDGANVNSKRVSFTTMAQAYIFTASAGIAAATASAATAIANATGRAKVSAADMVVTNTLSVLSEGASIANAKVDNITLSLIAVGILVGYSYAEGTFEAILQTTGNVEVTNEVTVETEYTADATCDLTPALGGFELSLVDVDGNVAYAEVKTIAKAGISGSGVLKAHKAITVKTNGTVSANAVIHGVTVSLSYVKIAVNIATAKLSANQSAYIINAHVITTGSGNDGNVTVRSTYNTDAHYDINGNPEIPEVTDSTKGAVATVGANSGPSVTLSIYSLDTNVATANSNSTSSAYLSGCSTDLTGKLIVDSFGTSYAKADIDTPDISAGAVNVAISATKAYASGTFKAYINSTGSDSGIRAASILVNVAYAVQSLAKVGPTGKLSASISVGSATVNVALSEAKATALAYLSGSGDIVSDSTIKVLINGRATAKAEAKRPTISVSLLNIAANATYANLLITQKAYMSVSGSVTATDGITVKSKYFADSGQGAVATVGTPNGQSGVSVSLIEGSINISIAKSELTNYAYITGGGTITAKNILVESDSTTRTVARAESALTIGLIALGGMDAEAYSADDGRAYIGSDTTIVTTGNETGGYLSVLASGDTTASALVQSPGSVTLASGSASNVEAHVGESDDKQTVLAYIGADNIIQAGGDVTVDAFNKGYATAVAEQGTNVSAIGVTKSVIPTKGYYLTKAYVDDRTEITAGGDITVKAEDAPKAVTEVNAENIGILASANDMYAKNTLTQRVYTYIGDNAKLCAKGGLYVLAISNASLSARTLANSGGIFDGGSLQAYNTVTRDTDVEIGDGATIKADYGNLEVMAQSGLNDYIYASATGNSAGLVTISSAKAQNAVTVNTDTKIGYGVLIQNTFNTITIAAFTGEKNMQSVGDYGSAALSSNPATRAYINDLTANAKVDIATGGSGMQTLIKGRYVNIYAGVKDMYISCYTRAATTGFHGTAKAYSTVDVYMDIDVTIGKAEIASYDKTNIVADATPTSSGANIRAYAYTKITAAIGSITSESVANGDIDATLSLGGNTVITGANVNIYAKRFQGTVSLTASGKRRALATKHTKEEDNINKSASTIINGSAVFNIFDAAAGIVIDIAADGTYGGVRAVGIMNEAKIWSVANGVITISQITNPKAGRLYISASIPSNIIYGQQFIPTVDIINHSGLDVVLFARH